MPPCQLWPGKTKARYPLATADGKVVYAHRLAYAKAHGLDVHTMGGVIRHRCDNPHCVNPEHLEIGTHLDNMRDMRERGRSMTGEKHNQAELTEEAVRYARAHFKFRDPEFGCKALAARFGVKHNTMSRAIRGVTWSHVT